MRYGLAATQPSTDGDNFWIAPNADVIGQVTLGTNVSIWWNAVLRGDNDPIIIGKNTNIQDGCVLHTDPGFPIHIAANVSVGHMSMLHGCSIGANSLIGIGSVVLNGAKIGANCLIGAKSLITEGKEIPDNSLVMGSPGKVIREVTQAQKAELRHIVDGYVSRWKRYRDDLNPLD